MVSSLPVYIKSTRTKLHRPLRPETPWESELKAMPGPWEQFILERVG